MDIPIFAINKATLNGSKFYPFLSENECSNYEGLEKKLIETSQDINVSVDLKYTIGHMMWRGEYHTTGNLLISGSKGLYCGDLVRIACSSEDQKEHGMQVCILYIH